MSMLDIATIVIIGLMVGNELTVSLFINPAMQQLEPGARAKAVSLFARSLGRVMPFWYSACLVLLIAETVLRKAQAAFAPLLTASILWAATILFSVLLLVPINNRMSALQPGDSPQWVVEHQRWENLHRLRILLLVVAMILVVHSLLR